MSSSPGQSRRAWMRSTGGGLLAGLLAACDSSRDASGPAPAAPPILPPASTLPVPAPDAAARNSAPAAPAGGAFFRTRGAVITPADLSLADWPERAARAGLTALALHDPSWPGNIAEFLETDAG